MYVHLEIQYMGWYAVIVLVIGSICWFPSQIQLYPFQLAVMEYRVIHLRGGGSFLHSNYRTNPMRILYVYAHTYVRICTYVRTYVCACTHTSIHMYCVYMHVQYIYIHIHIHILTTVCTYLPMYVSLTQQVRSGCIR